jgi:hypothetical protein
MNEELVYERRPSHPRMGVSIALGLVGVGIGLVGLYGSPLLLAVGIVLVVAGASTDRVQWICGACGNPVEKTSTMCPHCRASLASMEEVSRMRIAEKRAERRAAKEELARRRAIQKSRGPKRGGR